MSAVLERSVVLAGEPNRVLEAGSGPTVVFLPGLGGLPRWIPFLDALAADHRVIAPSLPGFLGGGPTGHHRMIDHLDWITTTLDAIEAVAEPPVHLVGASVGGLLAAEVAVLSPALVDRLVLIAPFGIYDSERPGSDPFAQTAEGAVAVQTAEPRLFAEAFAPPDGVDPVEWKLLLHRSSEAAARILWPFGDRGLRRRLHRLRKPTLLLWGTEDRVLPPSYAEAFAALMPGKAVLRKIPGAGHQVVIDRAESAAKEVAAFVRAGETAARPRIEP